MDTRIVDFRANTTQEIFDWLQKQELGLVTYWVDCVVDDIEIPCEELVEAFENGECPGDLQFF